MTRKVSKTQIDRLGDRLRRGPIVEMDLRMLDEYRRSFGDAYEHVVRAIRDRLGLDPTGRPAKSTGSIIDKLRRESIRLSQVQDITGCRIVVTDLLEQDRVVESLRALFSSASVVDRRAVPTFGYRAVHMIVPVSGQLIEIQVRSRLQHLWAELSEKCSDRFGSAIKYGEGNETVRRMLMRASDMVADQERPEASTSEKEWWAKVLAQILGDWIAGLEDPGRSGG